MAAASLLFRFNADTSGLKTGVSAAKSELDKLSESASGLGNKLLSAFPTSIGTEARNIGTAVGSLIGAFGGLGGAMAALGIAGLANDFLNTTGALTDLSSQTEVTVRDLQRFQYAGDLVGVSLDSIVGAVGQLQNRLGSGDKSAFAALDQLGLTFRELQRLDPGQQFESIASAISRIPDPSKRAAVAMDLFGRTGVTLMPLLRSDLKAVGDQAFVMSDDLVRMGDNAGDTLTKLSHFGKVFTATLFEPLVRWVEDAQAATRDLGNSLDVLRGKMDAMPALPSASGFGGRGGPPEIGMSVADALRLSEQLDRQIVQANEATAKKVREAAAAYRELTAAAQEMVSRGIKAQLTAERELWGQSVQSGLLATLRESRTEMLLMPPVMIDWAEANKTTTQTLLDMVAAGKTVPELTAEQIKGFTTVTEKTQTWRDSLTDLAQAMTQLSQTAGSGVVSAFASVVNAMNVGTKAIGSLKAGFADFTSGKGLSGILSGMTGIVSGIGGIVSTIQTAIQVGKALFSTLKDVFGGPSKDELRARDLVKEFEESLWDTLSVTDKLAAGNEAWKMTTIAVRDAYLRAGLTASEAEAAVSRLWASSRSGAEASQRAIDEIKRVFGSLPKTIHDGVGAVLQGIEMEGLTIPIRFDVDDFPQLASGGIVQRPTLALIGEAGPEAVVPLGQLGRVGGGDRDTLEELQGMRAELRRLPDVMFRAMRDAKALA